MKKKDHNLPVPLTDKFRVSVLRLGHRLVRDERISTHIGLVSRAFGAKELIIAGADDYTSESIEGVSKRWGGDFGVSYTENWRKFMREWKGTKVHLTMYGESLSIALPKVMADAKSKGCLLLLVLGGEKVPKDVYTLADFNVAIGSQPHSEVAALAVFLDRLFMGEELNYQFAKAKFRITPSLRGKVVEISDTKN